MQNLLLSRVFTLAAFALFIANTVKAETIINDPIGDSSIYADVISISGGFGRGNLYLTATFSNGSLNRANLGFTFGLDIDQDSSTGVQPPAIFPLGADFELTFNSLADSSHAILYDSTGAIVGTFPITFWQNSLSIVLPLSAVRNDDGLMFFGFIAGIPTSTNSFRGFDIVPDNAAFGSLGGPTSVMPDL